MKLREATVGDVEKIVSLVKESFIDYYLDAMIFGCHGIEFYLKYQLKQKPAIQDLAIYVLENDDQIVSVTQFKRNLNSKQFYLNYVCTAPGFRGKHLASYLLRYSIEFEKFNFEWIALDVFSHNTGALKWYRDLGFISNSKKVWSLVDVQGVDAVPAVISEFPQAAECHRAFGFSQITVISERKSYTVGIMGEKYFRVTDEALIVDKAALVALKMLDANRRVLHIGNVPADLPLGITCDSFASTENLSISATDLKKNLNTGLVESV